MMTHAERPLNVVAFLDGRPGHEKQTRGILTAMSRLTSIQITFKNIVPGNLCGSIKGGFTFLRSKFITTRQPAQSSDIDLIIGTGAHTHIPMLQLKRWSGSKTATVMSPAFYLIREFDLCFIPQHDGIKSRNNIFFTIGPPNSAIFREAHQQHRGLILVGGEDPKSHYWNHHQLLDQIRLILQKGVSLEWTLSSSPRTPPETIRQLDRLALEVGNSNFYRSEDTPSGWIEEQYSLNRRVWVSADSISMVYEAITAGCCVGILPVRWKRKTSKIKRSIDYLLTQGWAISFEQWKSGQDLKVPHHRLDEAGRCAQEILRRWWPNRLG